MTEIASVPNTMYAALQPTVRQIRAAESAAFAQFAASCFVDTYSATSSEADINTYVSQNLANDAFGRAADDPASTLLVVEANGDWIGCAHVRLTAIPLHVPPVGAQNPVELVRFYVRRSHHGRGVANILFEHILQVVRAHESDTLWLAVWQENARAISYYKRQGFRFVGTAHFQMGDELQDDFIMLRTLSDPVSRHQRSL